MPRISKDKWDWARIQYETDPTATIAGIARELGCTRQAVSKKVNSEDWEPATKESLDVAKQLDISKPVKGSLMGKRSPETIAQLINAIALLRSEALACDVVGIDDSTLRRWKKEDPDLARQVKMARARKVTGWVQCIDQAARSDWKAADRLLKIAPETRDQFGESHDKGPTIVLNIHRDEVTINQD